MGGPAWTMVKKALRVRRKMFALARTKENTLRELAGYPPLKSWWENCYGGCMATFRVTICRGFCPCFVGRFRFKSFFCPRTTCCGRCFYEGDYENEVLKNVLGFVLGVALTVLFYAWLCLQKDYPKLQAAVISCVVGVLLTLGMAFAQTVRCLVFLTLPSMFSKKGRNMLVVYATVLVFTYPATNVATNLKIMADSSTCGQSLMMNETSQLMAMATDPLAAVVDALEEMYRNIKSFASALMEAFKALIRAVKEIVSAVGAVFKWLYSLVDICNETMGAPYRKCKKAFDDAYDDCRDRLGIFGFLCEIVSAASKLCNLARIGELLCAMGGAIKDIVLDSVKKATVGSISDLQQMFFFEIDIERRYNYSMNQSRPYTEIKDAIMAEVSAKVSGYSGILGVVDNVMMVMVFYVFIKAWRYRRGYLTKDGFDNYYITQQVYTIEEKRKELMRETIFPLKVTEQGKYIHIFDRHLTRKESRKMMKGVAFWFLGAYNAGFYLLMDYGLYWLLAMVSRHLNVKTTAAVPPFMQLHVNGEGPLADMYRTMVGLLDPLADSGLDIDTSACLPIPSKPNMDAYRTIVVINIICLFLAVGEAYGLRLRRAVAACYYPKRERQRAVWLYNQILFKRGSFFKFARRQIRRKYKDDQEIQKMSIRGRIVRQCPRLGRLVKMCGYDFKNCIVCGKEGKPQDMDNFTHCANHGCNAVYCNECFADLNNMCSICMNPVDYGDQSDASEEMDSSEDEEMLAFRKRRAKEKRAKLEAKRKEQEPKNTMARFKGLVGVPDSKKLKQIQQGDDEDDDDDEDEDEDEDDRAKDPLLKKGDSGRNRDRDTNQSADKSRSTSSEEEFDQSYQYANKSQIPTSASEETSSDDDYTADGNRNRNMNWPGRKIPQYVTLDIFNVEPEFTVVTDGEFSNSCRGSFGSDSDSVRVV